MRKYIIALCMVSLLLSSCVLGRYEQPTTQGAGSQNGGFTMPDFSDPSYTLVSQVSLKNGSLEGMMLDNVINAHRQGSGFNPLAVKGDAAGPNLFNEGAVGLNYEHVFNGAAADFDLSMFTPRTDTVRLYQKGERSAFLHWPAESSSWGQEAVMEYTLDDTDSAIDITFTTRFTEDRFPMGWVAMMWASYMEGAEDRRLHFYGKNGGQTGWQTFGEMLYGNIEMGSVGYVGTKPLPVEPGSQQLNCSQHPTKEFLTPMYYGLMQQSHPDDPDVPMAFVMMFDQSETIRFSMWNFYQDAQGNQDTTRPAWDWHYIIRDPEPGKTYQYRARLALIPFHGNDSVVEAYQDWKNEL